MSRRNPTLTLKPGPLLDANDPDLIFAGDDLGVYNAGTENKQEGRSHEVFVHNIYILS